MALLSELKSWEKFKLNLSTYQVFLHPLCHHTSKQNGQTLCINLGTKLMEWLPRKARVVRV